MRIHMGRDWLFVALASVFVSSLVQPSARAAERTFPQFEIVESMLINPAPGRVNVDISWEAVATHAIARRQVTSRVAAVLNRYQDRFPFGTDTEHGEVRAASKVDPNLFGIALVTVDGKVFTMAQVVQEQGLDGNSVRAHRAIAAISNAPGGNPFAAGGRQLR
jgi:hypothetical protein